MVHADEITQPKRPPHPINPPFEPVCAQAIPIVEWIAPQLSRLAEIIRRDTCDHARISGFVEFEILRVRPHIDRIVRDKDWQIAEDPNAVSVGIIAKRFPLAKEKKLPELMCL